MDKAVITPPAAMRSGVQTREVAAQGTTLYRFTLIRISDA